MHPPVCPSAHPSIHPSEHSFIQFPLPLSWTQGGRGFGISWRSQVTRLHKATNCHPLSRSHLQAFYNCQLAWLVCLRTAERSGIPGKSSRRQWEHAKATEKGPWLERNLVAVQSTEQISARWGDLGNAIAQFGCRRLLISRSYVLIEHFPNLLNPSYLSVTKSR